MSEPFVGEIRMVSFGFVLPRGWAYCNGATLPINQNQPLFALLGTTYGGNGQTTFNLPNLQARVPLHVGPGFVQGQQAGEASHTLIPTEMPAHTHPVAANASQGNQPAPNQHALAANGTSAYGTANDVIMSPQAAGPTGGSQAHENQPPFLVVNFMIALTGIFPSRS
jgi:microcystin-dependent protein